MKNVLALFVFVSFTISLFGQDQATALILTNRKAKILLDGEDKGVCEANTPFRVTTTSGEHYAQVRYEVDGVALDKGEIITLEAGKQKIIKLLFDDAALQATALGEVPVGEFNFAIPGVVNVAAWQNQNPNARYPYPVHYVAFEAGDEIILNASMTNKNGTNVIEVATYPNGVMKYTNKAFVELKDLRIKVESRSIYQFAFATNHAFDRNCVLKISRKPGSPASMAFNTHVSKQKIFKPVSIVEPTSFRVNSGSNAEFKGGKSRIIVPVNMPANTVEWFYRFSATRDPAEVESTRKSFQLFGELTKLLLDATGVASVVGEAVGIGVEQLTLPPGSNHCDVFLLDYNNIGSFQAKTEVWQYTLEGSRQNLKSGNVKVSCCNTGQYYLGVRNPDLYDGIDVTLEIIAVTLSEDYVMEAK